MLQMLLAREQGLDPPWLLPAVYCSRRFASVELSREKELDRAHRKGINSLDLDKEGRYLVSGGGDKYGTIAIHDLLKPHGKTCYRCPVVSSTMSIAQPGRRRVPAHTENESHAISMVQWYPHDTGIFTSSSVDKKLRIWDTNELCVVEKFSFSQPIYTHSMAAATTHCLIAAGGKECKITLCDMQSGSATHILQSHRKPVMALAWSPRDDHLIASGSQDNKILMWDVRRARGPLLCLDQHNGSGSSNLASVVTAHGGHVNGLRFTSDGLFLVSFGTDNQLRLWDAFSGRNTLVNYGKVWNTLPQQTCQFAITPHTTTLHPVVCVPSGGDLVMLEMITGKKLRRLQGHFGEINCLAVHPYEQELYSGGSDTNILAWVPPPPPAPRQPQQAQHAGGVPTVEASQMLPDGIRASRYYQDTWSDEDD